MRKRSGDTRARTHLRQRNARGALHAFRLVFARAALIFGRLIYVVYAHALRRLFVVCLRK